MGEQLGGAAKHGAVATIRNSEVFPHRCRSINGSYELLVLK
jgi:hypothetical protein